MQSLLHVRKLDPTILPIGKCWQAPVTGPCLFFVRANYIMTKRFTKKANDLFLQDKSTSSLKGNLMVMSYLVGLGGLCGFPQDNTMVVAKMVGVLAAPAVGCTSIDTLEPGVSQDLLDRSTLGGIDLQDAGHDGAALAGEKLENALLAFVARLGKRLVGGVLIWSGNLPGEATDGHAHENDAQ